MATIKDDHQSFYRFPIIDQNLIKRSTIAINIPQFNYPISYLLKTPRQKSLNLIYVFLRLHHTGKMTALHDLYLGICHDIDHSLLILF